MTSFGRFLFSAGGYPLTGEVRWEEKERWYRSLSNPRWFCHAHMSQRIHAAAHLVIMWPFVARGMPMCVEAWPYACTNGHMLRQRSHMPWDDLTLTVNFEPRLLKKVSKNDVTCLMAVRALATKVPLSSRRTKNENP